MDKIKDSRAIRCLKGKSVCQSIAPYTTKYFIWHDLWPIKYPPPAYCNGQCAALTAQAAEDIYQQAMLTNPHNFRIEDFYYQGILRQKAGIYCNKTKKLVVIFIRYFGFVWSGPIRVWYSFWCMFPC